MIKRFKSFLWVVFLASGLQASWGFALLGPPAGYPGLRADFGDAWQTAVIGYDLAYGDESSLFSPGGPVFLGDIGGPKNIGEEYRRNARTIYYAYDANFLGFFGTDGATAADGAFAIMNSLTNVTSYSPDLSEFPLNSQHFNYRAQSLFLTDVKSVTLHLLIEQMGLAEPERFSWTLAERFLPTGGVCPLDELYLVLQRNFDFSPTALNQIQYSSYVNDVLYSYYIVEACTGPNPLAITVPFAVDPLVEQYTAVAANNGDAFGGLRVGGFYTGLTRDDAAGLRYLLATNNVNWESAAAGSILTGSTTIGVTNLGAPFLLFASNYTAFALSAQTNDLVTLSNLFPGLVIVNSSYYFTNMVTPNIVAYFTNFIGAPYGSPPTLVVTTNGFTSSFPAIFSDTFANLIIINYQPNTSATLVTVSATNQVGAPFGNPLVTNTSTQTIILTNVPSGDYYISTNPCGPDLILSTLGTNVTATTNLIFSATNSAGYSISQSVVTYSCLLYTSDAADE